VPIVTAIDYGHGPILLALISHTGEPED